MKDLENLHYLLGIEVVRSSSGLFLLQKKYVHHIFHKFHLRYLKLVSTPSVVQTTLSVCDGELLVDPSEYCSMIGALHHLTITRSNIAYAVHVVSNLLHALCTTHFHAVTHIFRYLEGNEDHSLFICSSVSSSIIIAYFGAELASYKDSCLTTTDYAMYFDPNPIVWHSKKQLVASKSTTHLVTLLLRQSRFTNYYLTWGSLSLP